MKDILHNVINQSHVSIKNIVEGVNKLVDMLEKAHQDKMIVELDPDKYKGQEVSGPNKTTRANIKRKEENSSLDLKDLKKAVMDMT